ncbi:MAG: HAMP domain-containing protein [Actinophytocola sp.]|nr:nitrate- and nitrite sensing domain-containing protein [Actinophytocola sp.]MPZ85560.1 HAMP domain-containing protein [Actinophytocola sp.]
MTSIRRGRALSIRTRVLAIALVPCFVFLIAGVAGTGYLIYDAAKTRNYFDLASQAQRDALPLIISLQEERRLTLRRLASYGTFQSELIKQRTKTDAVAGQVTTSLSELGEVAPESVKRDVTEFATLMSQLPELRARVDGGQVGISESFTFYNRIVDQFISGTQGLAQFGPDAESAYQLQVAVGPLLTSADQMQRADALASANLIGGGLTDNDFRTYQGLVSAYHLQLENSIRLVEPELRTQYAKIKDGPAWQRLISVEDVLLRGQTNLPISEDLWRAAARDVGDQLMGLLTTQARATIAFSLDKVNSTLTQSVIAGVLVLLLSAAVFVFAVRMSRRIIERLTRLRRETLELAESKLPELVEKVRAGQDVRMDDSLRLVDHGKDEIGEVADAFNKAQQTAVTAAVQEAKTREGTKTVFLNIAHRSQVIVHRQLKVLDEAERRQEDPEQLEMLFQLDHLSTRARRNAENLIILGGGQPGRRWRNPVSLTELARGAAAETEHFARVKIAKLPSRAVNGPVVGDLVHLLAELIDNATSFSPPESRVEVRGNVVGRGAVLEIEDQGLGIESARIDELNTMLANPPDFGIMALSTEPRLGLFVVARLAARHGISVSLRESAYGGTRAIVLVRAELLGEVPVTGDHPEPAADSPSMPTLAPAPPIAPVSSVKLPIPVTDLPPLPIVVPRPGEDLFRPQRPVEEPAGNTNGANGSHTNGGTPTNGANGTGGAHARHEAPTERHLPVVPAPQPARPPEPVGQLAQGRPPLPQRRRQQNLVAQLREEPAATWPEEETREESPDEARNRLSAFQRGTRRGREEPATSSDGDNTLGSVRNGQHRSE